MKPLIPSHREKKRYLLVKSKKSFEIRSVKDFRKRITRAVEEFLGVLGMAEASLKFIDSGFNSGNKEFWTIICINRKSLEKVRATFCVFSDGTERGIKVENVSGTLKKLREQSKK